MLRLWQDSHKSTRGWKVTFWGQSEENSVWILKLTTLLEIFCNISFTPAVTSCYQQHALNVDPHLSAALLCYVLQVQLVPKSRCCQLHTARNSPHLICAADGHYTRNRSCITLLWLHNNHKTSTNFHKNGLISSHQSFGRWLIFYMFCSTTRILDETSWLSPPCLSLCQDGIRGWNHFT